MPVLWSYISVTPLSAEYSPGTLAARALQCLTSFPDLHVHTKLS